MTYIRRFFAFWYDFLIGEKIELFVGPILAMIAIWAAVSAGLDSAFVGLLFFALVALVGGFSLWRSLRAVPRG
jgi:hypothetical protein